MRTSQSGLDLIKEFEGFRAKPYLCSAKVPTIGYGSTMYENGFKVKLSDPPISEEKALDLFAKTLVKYEQAVEKAVTVDIGQHEFDACVSLCYNIGGGNFASSTLVKMINAGDEKSDIAEQFLRWNKAGGKVIDGLTRRRQAERQLFLKA
jgi:lysozyme